MFGWDIEVDAWLRFWRGNLIKICARTTQPSGPLCLWQCFGTPFMRKDPCHTNRRNNKGEYNGIMIGLLPLVASKRRAPLAVLPGRTMCNIIVFSSLELVIINLHLQLFLLQLLFLCREPVEQFKSLLSLLLAFFLVFFTFQWNYQNFSFLLWKYPPLLSSLLSML